MRVCVTGSAGFIGSNLVEACLEKGWDVVGIDNLSNGSWEMANPERFKHLPGSYRFRELDINDTELLKEIFYVDSTVFHLAAQPRVQFSTDYPIESNYNNINGTVSVLEAAKFCAVKRVVYSASSSMYGGENIPFPTPETTPAHPRSNYALQKYTGLEYCRLFSELYGLDTISLIYFNVMGKYQRANSAYATVIPAFFNNSVTGAKCRIDGPGTQVRDFCHVDNVVQANILAATSDKTFVGDKFNIACGEHHSVLDVYNRVKELSDNDLEKYHVKSRLGDPIKSHADILKARSILGYEPKIKFDEAMRLTSQWWLGEINGCRR